MIIGRTALPPVRASLRRCRSSVPSSMMVRSAAEVRVKDVVEAHIVERRRHFSGDAGADFHSEFLAERRADGGGDLDGDALRRVLKRRPDLADGVCFDNGARRADGGTLAAHGAVDAFKRQVHGGGDRGVKAPVLAADGADALNLIAGRDAAAAEDAFCRVAGDGGGDVEGLGRYLVGDS